MMPLELAGEFATLRHTLETIEKDFARTVQRIRTAIGRLESHGDPIDDFLLRRKLDELKNELAELQEAV